MNINITQRIKSAFVFKMLPDTVKSFVISRLSNEQIRFINASLGDISALDTKQQILILREFHNGMNIIHKKKKAATDRALVLTFCILALVSVSAIVYSFLAYSSLDDRISVIEQILNNGGMHMVLFPYVHSLITIHCNKFSVRLLLQSNQYGIDCVVAYLAAMAIAALFFATSDYTQPVSHDRVIAVFTFIIAVTVAPALEELFFRYFFFYYTGKKTGYILTAIASSFIFTIIHIPDSPLLFGVYFCTGLLLCTIVYTRKSIFPAFAAHAAANGILLLL